jgi:hypothetical protein
MEDGENEIRSRAPVWTRALCAGRVKTRDAALGMEFHAWDLHATQRRVHFACLVSTDGTTELLKRVRSTSSTGRW